MNRRRKLIIGIFAGLAVVVLVLATFRSSEPSEPEFQKTAVSRWFARFCLRNRVQLRGYDGLGAMRAMGTNAIAYLVMLNGAAPDSPEMARVELQAQRELGSGDGPMDRMERTFIRLIDAEADPRRITLIDPGRVQEEVFNALSALKPHGEVLLPLLDENLKNADPRVRERALSLLGCIGANAELAEPYLVRALGDDDEKCRAAAAEAVGWSGRRSKALAGPLIAALDKASQKNRTIIGWALGKMGADAADALPTLVQMLAAEKGSYDRITIAAAIHGIDSDQPDGFRVLIEGLTDPSLNKLSAKALGPLWKTRTNAVAAMPVLARVLEGQGDLARRVLAAQAVCDLDSTNQMALKVLVEALGDRNQRKTATGYLASVSPRPVVPLALLIDVLPEEDLIYDPRTLGVFLELGPQKDEAIAALAKALGGEGFRLRVNAAACLLRLDPNNAAALAVLGQYVQHLEYPGWVVRAADAFGVAGTNASDAIPLLTKLLPGSTGLAGDSLKLNLEKIRPVLGGTNR